jgi:hypothetical protein
MDESIPQEVLDVFEHFVTTEYTTIDKRLQPITWPVNPYFFPGADSISITTGIGFPKKADDAAANPKVSLLFSEAKGSGLQRPGTILVQGLAEVDDADLDANRDRYTRESRVKIPGAFSNGMLPPVPFKRIFGWYYLTRIYVHVRPLRVLLWPDGEYGVGPTVFVTELGRSWAQAEHARDRNGGGERPTGKPASPPERPVWDERIDELGQRYENAVLSFVDADGFPFAARLPVVLDRAARTIEIAGDLPSTPLRAGRACLTAHEHDPDFAYMCSFQVRGQLTHEKGRLLLYPQKLIGGFEMPPTSSLARHSANLRTMLRYRRTARRVLAERRPQPRPARGSSLPSDFRQT